MSDGPTVLQIEGFDGQSNVWIPLFYRGEPEKCRAEMRAMLATLLNSTDDQLAEHGLSEYEDFRLREFPEPFAKQPKRRTQPANKAPEAEPEVRRSTRRRRAKRDV